MAFTPPQQHGQTTTQNLCRQQKIQILYFNMEIAAKIHEALRLLGVSQKEFAASLGISGNAITEIIKGRTRNITDSVKIAAEYVYGIDRKWWDDSSENARFLISEIDKPKATIIRGEGLRSDPDIAKSLDSLVKTIERKVGSRPESGLGVHGESYHRGELREIPELGRIAAGPLNAETAKHGKVILFPRALISERGPLYALKVHGESMRDANIHDGDYAILKPVPNPTELKPGAIVAALVDGENTLKRLYLKNDGAILRAANPNFRDIEVRTHQELVIQGHLKYLIKKWQDE